MMPLQSVRPNIVQAIRAFRVDDLMHVAQETGQHFLYVRLGETQSKQDVLEAIAEAFLFPSTFGKSLDALYDCMTDLVNKAGSQPGFILVLEQLPDNPKFDREAREQLLDVFRDAAEFWADRKVPFRCFYSFSVSRSQELAQWEQRANEPAPAQQPAPKPGKHAPQLIVKLPPMSSAFDTGMLLAAA